VADDPDIALTVALAEYEHLREARRANNDQSTARFNFFLVVASAATAVAGGLITGGGSGAANASAVAGIGALVLLLGLTVFVRQVEFTNRARLYAVAIDTVRTYLTRRAPEVAPYLIMPTLDNDGAYQGRPPGGRWLHDAIGMAGTVGLVNSALLAVGTELAVRRSGTPTWLAVACGVAVLAAMTSTHIWYVNRRTGKAFARIWATVQERHPPGATATARPAPTGQPDS
jgi:hypothetical protein